MRKKDVYVITCAKCHKEDKYEDYSCVGPNERDMIMNDSIMTYTCPYCHETSFLKHPLTYIDHTHRFIVQYGQDEKQFSHFVDQMQLTSIYKGYTFRYTDSWLGFKEKIMILENRDDRLIELYKLALKQELKADDKTLFLYNKDEDKELMIALSPIHTRAYIFNRNWYDLKENDDFITRVLKYDTHLVIDRKWAESLYDYRLKISLCEVETRIQVKLFVIPSYTHVEIGDEVYVLENGEKVKGKVMTKNYKSIMDLPHHLGFIEKTISSESEYDLSLKEDYKNITSFQEMDMHDVERFLDILNDMRFYYYLVKDNEDVKNYSLDHLIPLYINLDEAKKDQPEESYLISDLLGDVLKMTFEKIDGYVLHDGKNCFMLDSQFIDMFVSYSKKKKTTIN